VWKYKLSSRKSEEKGEYKRKRKLNNGRQEEWRNGQDRWWILKTRRLCSIKPEQLMQFHIAICYLDWECPYWTTTTPFWIPSNSLFTSSHRLMLCILSWINIHFKTHHYRILKWVPEAEKWCFSWVEHGWCVWLTTLPPSVSLLSRQCGILNISQPYRPPRPVIGLALLYGDGVCLLWGTNWTVGTATSSQYLADNCEPIV
jgi:hypothetical protein